MSEVIETTAEQIVDVPTGNDLMAVTQLPVITEQLESLTNVIKAKVDYALSLSVTEESYREIKSIRADLNADYNDLEQRRKTIKKLSMHRMRRLKMSTRDVLHKTLSLQLTSWVPVFQRLKQV